MKATWLTIFTIAFGMTLGGCANKARYAPVERQNAEIARHRAEDLASVQRYSALPGCSGDDVRDALADISRRMTVDDISDQAELRFALANAAMDKNCLDTAKVHYAYIVSYYSFITATDMQAHSARQLNKIREILAADRPPPQKPITLAAAMDAIQRFSNQQKCIGDATQPAEAAVRSLRDYAQTVKGVRNGPDRRIDLIADYAEHDHTAAAFALA